MKKRIDEIEFKISQGEMDAYQVFTQMRQLIKPKQRQSARYKNKKTGNIYRQICITNATTHKQTG